MTAVEYSTEREVWFVKASLAKEHQYDDRLHIPVSPITNTIVIDVGGDLSRCIKAFNSSKR